MSLDSNISDLATRVGQEIKDVRGSTQTALDLKAESSEIYTKTQIDSFILNYYTETKINQFMQDYYTKGATNSLLESKADLENGKVKLSQLPDSVLGQVEYKGLWDASTNTPNLTTVLGVGKYYITNTTGTFNSVVYAVGDWIVSNGVTWDKVDNTDAVSSVNGSTGNVVITKSDLGLGNVDNTSDLGKPLSTATTNALGNKADKATTLSGYGITDAISSNTQQTANYVLIAPNGSNGAPTFRLLLESDLPNLSISKIIDLTTTLSGKSDTSHNHNLNDLSEKSYNSLTDTPDLTLFPASTVHTKYFSRGSGTAGTTGVTGVTPYALFPSAQESISLEVGVYKVTCNLYISVAVATTSASLGFNIRGTGTAVGNIYGTSRGTITNGGSSVQYSLEAALGTNITVTAASNVAGRVYTVNVEAVLDITTAGTIIPSYQLSATLSRGVVTLSPLNNMIIEKIANSSVATTGGWA